MLIPVSREIFLPVIVWSLALGIISGAVYDIFRIRRAAFRIPGTRFLRGGKGRADTVLTFFEDILFSLFCTSVFILIGLPPELRTSKMVFCGGLRRRILSLPGNRRSACNALRRGNNPRTLPCRAVCLQEGDMPGLRFYCPTYRFFCR